jgi:hypothetical protein
VIFLVFSKRSIAAGNNQISGGIVYIFKASNI